MRLAAWIAALVLAGCGPAPTETLVTFPGSAVGAEAELLRVQLERFMESHPEIRVVQRRTPDAADQRRQLYVQWLNAGADDPDILQLDVIWTTEFAAAGWILPLERFEPETADFLPAALAADRWRDSLYALPWFVDVGMLYWRTDLLEDPPSSYAALAAEAEGARATHGVEYGLVWQGARYEGLVTVFLEYLTAFGGTILDSRGAVALDSPAAVRALTAMRDAVDRGWVPREALTWHEEETRFAFQNGRALFMRNWPYAYALMQDATQSRVAGRFAVAPMPGEGSTAGSAALGGSQLAINANSDQPDAAWAVIDYLTKPEQMLERARELGHLPARSSLYADPTLGRALPLPPEQAKRIIDRAIPRPTTPIYAQLSELLQVQLHRALAGQSEPADAIAEAASQLRALHERLGLTPGEGA